MPKFDLIVFDWDGTLMDSAAAIVHAIQSASRDLRQPIPDDATARHVIGLGLEEALRHVAPHLPATQYPEMAARYRHYYLSRDHELTLFAGVRELLIELTERGFMLAVATGKSQQGLDRALDHFGLRPGFQALRCADQCPSKPHPQMLFELMEELGSAPERTLMIGDTTHDLQMAQNAGTASIGVSYGAHPATALQAQNPLACVDSVAALREWFKQADRAGDGA
ncbi:haloacid dehalogenase [Betaproteobacteria bacterium]|nr:haloacid dehalogenase [Betaproteobacteria bacterium]GHU46573.1 haloacid dehalogenase [Betaproteobacteria bacterium]